MSKSRHRSSGRRRTIEREQEAQSRHQLKLEWKSWLPWSPEEDVGEDLLFQINENGNSTGLSFYVQLKSTTNLERHRSRRQPKFIAYRVKTKDVTHWDGFSSPVVLVLWDVTAAQGLWLDLPSAIEALDKGSKAWRRQSTTTILLPRSNTCDEEGRRKLRLAVGHIAFPTLARGKAVEFAPTFRFPHTAAGKKALEALERAINDGTTATIDKEYLLSFRASGWFERIFGKQLPERLTIRGGTRKDASLSVRLEAVLPDRTQAVPIILHRVRAGLETATFRAKNGVGPVRMELIVNTSQKGRLSITISFGFGQHCRTVHEALSLAQFFVAAKQGGAIQIVLPWGRVLRHPQFLIAFEETLDQLLAWQRLLENLNFVQSRVARFGTFKMADLSDTDVSAIQRLHAILSTGVFETRMDLAGRPRANAETGALDPTTSIVIEQIDVFEDLLGIQIPLGRVLVEFLDPFDFRARMTALSAQGPEQTVTVHDIPVRLHCPEWMPPNNGPEQESRDGMVEPRKRGLQSSPTTEAVRRRTSKARSPRQ